MSALSQKDRIEIALKVVGTLIAAFAIWKYFDEQRISSLNAASGSAISYINRFSDPELTDARKELQVFWRSHPQIGQAISEGRLTRGAYNMFVDRAFPAYEKNAEMTSALFSIRVFFDELAYCRSSEICDPRIIDEFFCGYLIRYLDAYRPFYAIIIEDIGSDPVDAKMSQLARECS